MWRQWTNSIFIFAVAGLSGCASVGSLTYSPAGDQNPGYFDHQRGVYKWMVGTYYNLREHTPQQAANILMRRSAELAMEQGFQWIRVLNYKTEMQKGTRTTPTVISLSNGSGVIYPGMNWSTNNDEWVSDKRFRNGATFARVEYFEFSRTVDCQREKCDAIDLLLEDCLAGGDGGAQETLAMCKNKIVSASYGGDEQTCMDKVRFLSKDVCKSVLAAAHSVNGFVEERNMGEVGAWYKAEDILNKYRTRTQIWANIARQR